MRERIPRSRAVKLGFAGNPNEWTILPSNIRKISHILNDWSILAVTSIDRRF
jgi:hypothetical protein